MAPASRHARIVFGPARIVPGVVTIQKLSEAPYSVAADRQIKTLVYQVDSKPVLILIRGDHQLNEAKFAGASGSTKSDRRNSSGKSHCSNPSPPTATPGSQTITFIPMSRSTRAR